MSEVLTTEWERALVSSSHDPDSACRIRAVQRVQTAVASRSRTFAHHPHHLDVSRLVQRERALVAELCARSLFCCRDPLADSGVRPIASLCTTLAPPMLKQA
jgi:hypothetical protein